VGLMGSHRRGLTLLGEMCRYIIGLLFVASAVLKVIDTGDFAVQVSYYGIIRAPRLVEMTALGVIALEGALGVALLIRAGRGRVLFGGVLALLVAFSILIAYAWAFRGLKDCGCFGKYVKMTPGWSIIKNAVLMGMVAVAWRAPREHTPGSRRRGLPRGLTRAGLMAGAALTLLGFGRADLAAYHAEMAAAGVRGGARGSKVGFAAFAFSSGAKRLELAKGLYVVAMLSESCEGCAETVRALNQMTDNADLPPSSVSCWGGARNWGASGRNTGRAFRLRPWRRWSFFRASAPPRPASSSSATARREGTGTKRRRAT